MYPSPPLLQIIHANVLDTALLFPHPRGPPAKSALRVLASRWLHRIIQVGAHDPVEDARAALDLALLKIRKGPAFGVGGSERGELLADALSRKGRRGAIIDRPDMLGRWGGVGGGQR
jgi:RNA exonuclease 1